MKISSFEIRNFRVFESLSLSGLERVNLIAGENNVGKTALLEALWQFTGPDRPDLGLRLNQFRGIQQTETEELLFDLFHDYDTSRTIRLSARGYTSSEARTLRIEIRARETTRFPLRRDNQGGESGPLVAESPHEIVLHYADGTGDYESSGWLAARERAPGIVQEGFESRRKQVVGRPASIYFGPRHRNRPQDEAEKYGRMEVYGSEGSIVEALRPFEPRLRRLATITVDGVPMIHADVRMPRMIPMGLLGDGIQRLLSFSLAFGDASGGMILLDEIENGIHHSRLEDLWHAISFFSKRFDVQVFATTHSRECVRAAHEAFSKMEDYDFSFLRLDRIGNGEVKVKTLDRAMLDIALNGNLEIR